MPNQFAKIYISYKLFYFIKNIKKGDERKRKKKKKKNQTPIFQAFYYIYFLFKFFIFEKKNLSGRL